MAEDESSWFSFKWLAAAIFALAVTAGMYFLLRLEWKDAKNEIFAALCEVSAGVVFISAGFGWHRSSQAKKRKKEGIMQALYRAATEIQHSMALIGTHKSAASWSRQLDALVHVRIELELCPPNMARFVGDSAADTVRKQIKEITDLEKEYRDNHDEVAFMQNSYERTYRDDPQGKHKGLTKHWYEVRQKLDVLSDALARRGFPKVKPDDVQDHAQTAGVKAMYPTGAPGAGASVTSA